MKLKPRRTFSYIANKALQLFLQGLIVIVPIAVTVYAAVWLFTAIDSILPNIVRTLFPDHARFQEKIITIPGLNFIILILLIIFIGWISSLFFISRLVAFFDRILEHTPGIKFIYTSVKDFLEAFAGNKKKFDKPVLVNVDGADVWRVGFITHEDAASFGLNDHAVVYVPHAYAVSGITYIVPKERIKLLTHTSSADAMKFTISGGVTEVEG
ncbi:DUF502 domain-containing protein [Ilyomonas limi]|uniref:DUF502 domain-containing protein n=1 Tax=Ilyomonas limi TaxID=2575867 RepID=A0A4U3LBZ1_9BACT|nr:DUF502 domain-containing protein [Ilyomonas limi]TKK71576.1 DUF502 domain-containing protein [Ilyomonas limi]